MSSFNRPTEPLLDYGVVLNFLFLILLYENTPPQIRTHRRGKEGRVPTPPIINLFYLLPLQYHI